MPAEGEIMDIMEVADPEAAHAVRYFIRKQLASELKAELLSTVCYLPSSIYFLVPLLYKTWSGTSTSPFYTEQLKKNRSSEEYAFNHHDMSRRTMKNVAVGPCY